jgi:hypothetical protein
VLQEAADGVQGRFAQARITAAGEQRVAPFPQRDVGVHAGAVVAVERLGHEGDGLVVLLGDVLDDVLVDQELVGHPHEVGEPHVDLALPARGHLVVLGLDVDAAVDHRLHHLVADVHELVRGGHREVALLVPQLVAQVRPLVAATVPLPLATVDVVEAAVGVLVVPHVVEHEELGLRPHVAGVGNARALQVVHGLAGHVPGIAAVVLAGDGVLDVADHHQGGERGEGIDEGRLRLRHHEHVALVDGLPAADARAVEAQAVLEHVFVELADRNREMLPQARKIHEPQVHGFHVALPAQGQYFVRRHVVSLLR